MHAPLQADGWEDVRLIEDAARRGQQRVHVVAHQPASVRDSQHLGGSGIGELNVAIIADDEKPARSGIEQRIQILHGACCRYSFISAIVSSGWLMWGQWPVADICLT